MKDLIVTGNKYELDEIYMEDAIKMSRAINKVIFVISAGAIINMYFLL